VSYLCIPPQPWRTDDRKQAVLVEKRGAALWERGILSPELAKEDDFAAVGTRYTGLSLPVSVRVPLTANAMLSADLVVGRQLDDHTLLDRGVGRLVKAAAERLGGLAHADRRDPQAGDWPLEGSTEPRFGDIRVFLGRLQIGCHVARSLWTTATERERSSTVTGAVQIINAG
jgi:hypothetical protein